MLSVMNMKLKGQSMIVIDEIHATKKAAHISGPSLSIIKTRITFQCSMSFLLAL